MSPGDQSTSIKKNKYLANALALLLSDPSNKLRSLPIPIGLKIAKAKSAKIYLKLKALKLFKKNRS